MRNIEIHYIQSMRDLPKSSEMVALFVIDEGMECGYRVDTGCYYEETVVIENEIYFKPRFLCEYDMTTDIIGRVFAWAELPKINIEEMRWHYNRKYIS